MNREDIIRMAREAGLGDTGVRAGFIFFQPSADGLERFFQAAYAAGAASEREACAKVCDDLLANPHTGGGWSDATIEAAVAIRARSNT